MIRSGNTLVLMVALPITLALATSGCATKKYVAKQIAPVNQKVAALDKKTSDRIAYLNNKEENDVSQLNERLSTTDQKVDQVAEAARQAQGTASRAMEEAEGASGKTQENTAAIATLTSGVANALNFQLVEKADVMFAFNKATLTPEAKQALDQIAAKAQSLPRSVIELAGFTDPRGTTKYNLALSRQRAWAVQRYLIRQKVTTASIHVVGMGEGAPPPDFAPQNSASSTAQRYQMDRRVQIRLFGAGDISSAGER